MGPSNTPPYEPDDGDGIFMDDYIEVISVGGGESDQMESDEEGSNLPVIEEDQDDIDQPIKEDPPNTNSFLTFSKHSGSKQCKMNYAIASYSSL